MDQYECEKNTWFTMSIKLLSSPYYIIKIYSNIYITSNTVQTVQVYLRVLWLILKLLTFTAPTVWREILFFKTYYETMYKKHIIMRNTKSINENIILNKLQTPRDFGRIYVCILYYIKHSEDRSSHCCESVIGDQAKYVLNDSVACDSLYDSWKYLYSSIPNYYKLYYTLNAFSLGNQ